ncbi:MAG TPA: universal stress protein, partial [Planctomycetota bacterium]|nr:universal stress protein [Planctomycetota bacterium]
MKTLRVLVPVDGSLLSKAILPQVRGLGAAPLVTVLRVIEPAASDTERLGGEVEVQDVAERLRAQGVEKVSTLVRYGKPAEQILEAAREVDAGAIAMVTHGRTGYDRLVVGSVAERVIRASPLPVLALRAAEPVPLDSPAAPLLERIVVPYDGSEVAWRAVELLALLGVAGRVTLLGVTE